MTDSLDATGYIDAVVSGSAESLAAILPAVIFVLAVGIAFATGTSWGTFGILIPIVVAAFTQEGVGFIPGYETIGTILVSACMAGAVCGDHCSPISDTTIMASAGGQCNHLNHVQTQLPYALTAAGVSFVAYIFAGFVQNVVISLIFAFVLMAVTLVVIKVLHNKKVKA
jgi:Na+/H+ antiporter NhaC